MEISIGTTGARRRRSPSRRRCSCARIGKVVAIPLVVFEIVLGLLLGPSLLGWIAPDDFIELLADFGLAMLFFLAGNEIDFARDPRSTDAARAAIGWLISLARGVGVAHARSPPIVGGGVHRHRADLDRARHDHAGAARRRRPAHAVRHRGRSPLGAVGEFGPLLAISLFLGGRAPLLATIVLLGVRGRSPASRSGWPRRASGKRLHRVITATLHTSGQFAVRLVIFVLARARRRSASCSTSTCCSARSPPASLPAAALRARPSATSRSSRAKIEAVGYGFLVPVFFINTGVTFDLEALFADPATSLLLPVCPRAACSSCAACPRCSPRPRARAARDLVATALFGATGLPIIVAVTAIGVDEGDLPSGTAAALVGAGMLSVLLFPLIALAIRKGRSDDPARAPADDPSCPSRADPARPGMLAGPPP